MKVFMKLFGLIAQFNYDFDPDGPPDRTIYSKVFLYKLEAKRHINLWENHIRNLQHPFGKPVNIEIKLIDFELISTSMLADHS